VVALSLREGHLHHCVQEASAGGSPDTDVKIAEAAAAVLRLAHS
jgi:CsoR family transcriptional regulator, copper-sensing transcriptional repressor